jgi:hypothetical protein
MINHMLMLIFSLLAPFAGGASTTNAIDPPIAPMTPTQGQCGGAPCADHCFIGGDEVQVTADDGTVICFHIEGDGYRIID